MGITPVSFATLLNTKIVVPVPFKTHFAVEKHFLAGSLAGYIAAIHLEPQFYFETYPDVHKAFGKSGLAGAKEHFVGFGYFEHRMPYRIEIDEAWYRTNYGDVEQAVAERRFPSAQSHFDRLGYAEGRLPFAGFELRMAAEV